MRAIDILRKFIKAEHTGNWELHLQAVYDMLPFFTASGHNLYAKSAYLYLQLMLDLPNNHPELYDMFMNGFHVIRRSDRYWAGVSSDMLIEHTLMRSLKTLGGLPRGRGMDEIQCLIWIMSKPACSEVNDVIQNLTSVSYTTSDQRKEAGCSRKERDLKDTREIIRFLKDRSPFENTEFLYDIVIGVTAGPKVNVDRAEIIGKDIVASMVDQNVFEFSFQRKNQATNMQTTGVVIGEESF